MPRTSPLLPILAAVGILGGCGTLPAADAPPPPPSVQAAHEYLEAVVEAATSDDPESVCRIGGSSCRRDIEAADPAAAPLAGPVVLASTVVPNEANADGSWDIGGVLLDLCGRDGTDRIYHAQMLVFDDGSGRLISINTVFWIGARLAFGNEAVAQSAPPKPCPGLDG